MPPAPAVAAVRLAVREALTSLPAGPVLVAVSGGADSLALAAATVFEASRRGLRVHSLTVDHALQEGSAQVAARTVATLREWGVEADSVRVDAAGAGGPEAAAREARYRALREAANDCRATAVLLGHTLDDQAETVLLGLARGSGAASLSGMPPERQDQQGLRWLRPLLGTRRETTRGYCATTGIQPWDDPHNLDPRFLRVRARHRALPVLEDELGPGVAQALARTAEQLREDAVAFDEMIAEIIEDVVEAAEAGIVIRVPVLAANPAALRHRIIRHVVDSEFGQSLTRVQTLEVARLVTDWRGQGPIDLPGCTAMRRGNRIVFTATG